MAKIVGHYSLTHVLGNGAFAVVYKGVRQDNQEEFAIKQIERSKLLNPRVQEGLESEISIMRDCTHENIVRLFDNFTTSRHVYLVLELCRGGDLHNYIKWHGRLDEDVTRRFLLQLERGLQYLGDRKLLHRDIKPQNLLLSEFSSDATLKLADFGMARALAEAALATTHCGSPLYMAPEILRNQDYDAKADLWSVGCVLFQMLTGSPPFHGSDQRSLLNNIEKNPLVFPEKIPFSNEIRTILIILLKPDPKKRASLQDFARECRKIETLVSSTSSSSNRNPSIRSSENTRSSTAQQDSSRNSSKEFKSSVEDLTQTQHQQQQQQQQNRPRGASADLSHRSPPRRNSDPLPNAAFLEGEGTYPEGTQKSPEDSSPSKDSRRYGMPESPPSRTTNPNTKANSVRPATATMVMGLGQQGHAMGIHPSTPSTRERTLHSPPQNAGPVLALGSTPVQLATRPPLGGIGNGAVTIGSTSSSPQTLQGIRGTVGTPPSSSSRHLQPRSPSDSPMGASMGASRSGNNAIVFNFGQQLPPVSHTPPASAHHGIPSFAVPHTAEGEVGNSSNSDDDFVIVENTNSHPWKAVNSGYSEQPRNSQSQQTIEKDATLYDNRSLFIAGLAQHCQRITGIVVAIVIAGDILVRDYLHPPSKASVSFTAWKERAKAAKTSYKNQQSPVNFLVCATAIYLKALYLLRDSMQRALDLRLSEPVSSQCVEPIDKLIEELALRFQKILVRTEACEKLMKEQNELSSMNNSNFYPSADSMLLHAASQFGNEAAVQQLLGDITRACESYQTGKLLLEAIIVTTSESNTRKTLQTLIKQYSEQLESCEKAGDALGYSRPAISVFIPSSSPSIRSASQLM